MTAVSVIATYAWLQGMPISTTDEMFPSFVDQNSTFATYQLVISYATSIQSGGGKLKHKPAMNVRSQPQKRNFHTVIKNDHRYITLLQ